MPRVVVEVMPKAELLDPQGAAVAAALARLGYAGTGEVRQGKRFEIEVDDVTPQAMAALHRAATDLLSNPVIEDVVSVAVADDPAGTVEDDPLGVILP